MYILERINQQITRNNGHNEPPIRLTNFLPREEDRLSLKSLTRESISQLSQSQKDLLWFFAAANDAHAIVKQLLEERSDKTYYINLSAEITFSKGTVFSQVTALSLAAISNAKLTATILLNHGADPNTCDSTYRNPLHYAALQGLVGMTGILLKHSANPNAQAYSGFTPLHLATAVSTDPQVAEKLIEKLIEKGARRDLVSDSWFTPAEITSNPKLKTLLTLPATTPITRYKTLVEALEAGDILGAVPLMKKSIPQNFKSFTETAKKTYLLTLAHLFSLKENHRNTMMGGIWTLMLIVSFPDIYSLVHFQGYPDTSELQKDFQIFDLFTDPQDIEFIQSLPPMIQNALLVLSVRAQHEQFVRLLLKAGISPEITVFSTSIIHNIVNKASSTGNFGVLQALIDSGYDINRKVRLSRYAQKTQFVTALEDLIDDFMFPKKYHLETITLLLKSGARYKLANTPRMEDIRLDVISALLEHGNYEPDDLKEFIFKAVAHLRDDIIELLANRGIDLNVFKDGKRPIDCVPNSLFYTSSQKRSRENILRILQENTLQMREIPQMQKTTLVQDTSHIKGIEMQDRSPVAVRHLFLDLTPQIGAPKATTVATTVSSSTNPAAPVAVSAQTQTLGRTAPTPVSMAPATATRAVANPPKTSSVPSLTTAARNALQRVSSSTTNSDKRRDNGPETRPLLSRADHQGMVDFADSDSETEEPVQPAKRRTAVPAS